MTHKFVSVPYFSRSWWWTGRPGVLRFMGSQRVDTTERLNWTELNWTKLFKFCNQGSLYPDGVKTEWSCSEGRRGSFKLHFSQVLTDSRHPSKSQVPNSKNPSSTHQIPQPLAAQAQTTAETQDVRNEISGVCKNVFADMSLAFKYRHTNPQHGERTQGLRGEKTAQWDGASFSRAILSFNMGLLSPGARALLASADSWTLTHPRAPKAASTVRLRVRWRSWWGWAVAGEAGLPTGVGN